MPKIKNFTKKDVETITLTKVSSGDQDNGTILGYLESNDDAKLKVINSLIGGKNSNTNPLNDLIASIYNAKIDDDLFRQLSIALSFFDIIREKTMDPVVNDPNAIYFAALVNWNVARGKGSVSDKIRSSSMISNAKEVSPKLDYSEYLSQSNSSESKFKNEFKEVTIAPDNYSSDMILKLPVIKAPLGFFKLMGGISAKLIFDTDKEQTEYNIPANIWMEMLQDGLKNKKGRSIRFYPGYNLSKLVDTSNSYILNILKINDFKKVYDFMNIYDIEYDADGHIVLHNTHEAPDLEENTYGLEWKPIRKGASVQVLKCRKFYLASNNGNAVTVYMN